MQAKKPETRAKHDKYRRAHIEKIWALYDLVSLYDVGSYEWLKIMHEIDLYEKQLKQYDKVMGYEE